MAGKRRKRRVRVGGIYLFALMWLISSAAVPLYYIWGILLAVLVSILTVVLYSAISDNRERRKSNAEKTAAEKAAKEKPVQSKTIPQKKSYGPEIDPIIEEGNRALSEMGRLYMSIKDPEIRQKINEIMRITDKITQDAVEDPSDIPQIKKFMNYYLPTTIKLLNAYDRMGSQGIEGENISKSMKSINEMLDAAIAAYRKRLDSLFENQALDIETDIEVMNTMLAREGLTGTKDFEVSQKGTN